MWSLGHHFYPLKEECTTLSSIAGPSLYDRNEPYIVRVEHFLSSEKEIKLLLQAELAGLITTGKVWTNEFLASGFYCLQMIKDDVANYNG